MGQVARVKPSSADGPMRSPSSSRGSESLIENLGFRIIPDLKSRRAADERVDRRWIYYKDRRLNEMFARYFTDAGFEVVAMEGLQVEAGEWGNISAQEIYISVKKCFLKHREAQGIYLLGSGAWRVADVVPVEDDLGVPVIHPVAARVYCVQRMMHIRQPVKGASRLLEEMP